MWRLRIKLKDVTQNTNTGSSLQPTETDKNNNIGTDQNKNIEAVQSNNMEAVQDNRIDTEPVNTDETVPDSAMPETPFSSRWAEYRALKKAKQSLPKTPAKKAKLIQKIVESPSTSRSMKGLLLTPEVKKMADLGENVVNTLKTLTDETKSGEDISQKKHAKKTLTKVLDSITEGTKTKRSMQKKTGLKRQSVHEKTWWECRKRKIRSDKTTEQTEKAVRAFYKSGEVSRCLPSKKDVNKNNEPKFVMTVPIREAFLAFKKKYPYRKIGITNFYKLKPKNVKKVSETNRKCCLCQVCCNAALALEAMNNFTATKQMKKEKLNKQSAIDLVVCDYTGEFAKPECLAKECGSCGINKLIENYQDVEQLYGDENITYYKWESVSFNVKDGVVKRCVSCVEKTSSVKDFLYQHLVTVVEPLASHLFRAKWQINMLETCKETLSDNEAVTVMDFSENYSCRFQNEVQSAFFDTNQVTIHPMMMYYKKDDVLIKHSLNVISDDLKHDAHVVHKCREKWSRPLKKMLLKSTQSKNLLTDVPVNIKEEWGFTISALKKKYQSKEVSSKHLMVKMFVTAWALL